MSMIERVKALIEQARASGYAKAGEEYLHMTEADCTALRDECIASSDSIAVYDGPRRPKTWMPTPYPTPRMFFMDVPVYNQSDLRVTYVGKEGRMIATLDPENPHG